MNTENIEVQVSSVVSSLSDSIRKNGFATILSIALLWFAWTVYTDVKDTLIAEREERKVHDQLIQKRHEAYLPLLSNMNNALERNTEAFDCNSRVLERISEKLE